MATPIQQELDEYLRVLRRLGANGGFVSHFDVCADLGVGPLGPAGRGWEILRELRMYNWVEVQGDPGAPDYKVRAIR